MTDIELQGIAKYYGSGAAAVLAVDNVDLSVAGGELYFLLGPSGCGKTTLLRIIAGLITPRRGRVRFGGHDVTAIPAEDRNTAMVFQNYALWPHMSVGQNVEFGPKMRGRPKTYRRRIVQENLQRVQMAEFSRRRPNQLSGGQQQRVALARALAAEPNCLLLDEPLSNLDARLRMHMRGQLRQLIKQSGTTAIYVTHDQKEALSMADRVAVMDQGRIVQVGTPTELYDRPATFFVADFLGEANFIDGDVAASGAPAQIRTPVGTFATTADAPPTGSAVTLCIRPERIAIEPSRPEAPAAQQNRFSAKIETSTYLGDLRQYVCRIGEDARWRVSVLAGAAPPLAQGQAVQLAVKPDDIAVLPR